jgi:hypothetical protein
MLLTTSVDSLPVGFMGFTSPWAWSSPSASGWSGHYPLGISSGAGKPVVTLNGWTLPWRMMGDWKEFQIVAEPVVRELAPGMKAHLWGYNGQSPGPTNEGG